MDKPVLSDKSQFPSDDIIYSHIPDRKKIWQSLFKKLDSDYPEFDKQWRYYNDGKSWLLKIVRKSKTVLWISVFQDYFKTAFYFGGKAESQILASGLSQPSKEQYKNGKRYGKIRAITLTPKTDKDIDEIMMLINLKLKIK